MERIEEPMSKLRNMNKSVLDTEEAKDVHNLYNSLMTTMAEYEQAKIKEWCNQVYSLITQDQFQYLLLSAGP